MSAGNVTWCMVGDESSRRTILVGTPVTEVKKAERACLSGDVILASSVWGHISPRDCVHEVLQGGHFIKVTAIRRDTHCRDFGSEKRSSAPRLRNHRC